MCGGEANRPATACRFQRQPKPSLPKPRARGSLRFHLAALLRGLVRCFLASAILFPVTVLLIWVMEAYHSEIGLSEFKSRTAMGTAAVLLWIVCFGLYCASAESSVHQATPGKRLLKMKVVSMSHGRLTFQQATWRYYAKFLSTFALLVGFAIAIFHSRKQSLHDMIAGTLVVRSE